MASSEPYIASVDLWAGTYAPRGWVFCQGQLLSISQFSAVFSLVGTVYGGDGRTTFGLPDLRGRVPVGAGQSPGTSLYQLGQQGGTEAATLTISNMPTHTHTVTVTSPTISGKLMAYKGRGALTADPAGAVLSQPSTGNEIYSTSSSNTDMGSTALSITLTGGGVTLANTGSSMPFNILQPYTCVNYIFALEGLFPPRD